MKILLLGKNGQVGWELQRTLAPLGELLAFGRRELDLADLQAIRQVIRKVNPDLIVNAAAYTAVDQAEKEPELAMTVNGIAPGIIAGEAARSSAALIHYSTDYVFDGKKSEPYTEEDAPNPLGVYGKTKLAGEEAIRQAGVPHLILRTGWVYGLRGRNFLLTMQRLASERAELAIVNDQHGAPTWCRQIAEATALLIARQPFKKPGLDGTYHLSAAGETTWFGFAEAIFEQGEPEKSGRPLLKAIDTKDYPTPAPRPPYSVLDNSPVREKFAIALPGWYQQLQLALDQGK